MPNTDAEHSHTDIDVLELLEEELKSCVMPAIKDPTSATTDELVKDMHRVLSGNGGMTRGLIYKVAASNVNTKLLRNTTNELNDRTTAIENNCIAHKKAEAQIEVQEAADKLSIRKVRAVLWGNRYLIVAILAGVIMVVMNNFKPVAKDAVQTREQIQRMENMIETIMKVEGIDPALKYYRNTNTNLVATGR